jgi:hypothetical protein
MGPILAIVAVGAVLALAFSSSRSAARSSAVGRADRLDEAMRGPLLRARVRGLACGPQASDHRSPGRGVFAQGLRGSRS